MGYVRARLRTNLESHNRHLVNTCESWHRLVSYRQSAQRSGSSTNETRQKSENSKKSSCRKSERRNEQFAQASNPTGIGYLVISAFNSACSGRAPAIRGADEVDAGITYCLTNLRISPQGTAGKNSRR